MSIFLSKELAVAGLLNILYYEKIYKDEIEIPSNYLYDINMLDGIPISIKEIESFCNWLHQSNCGAVIKLFTKEDIMYLLNNKNNIFTKSSHDTYVIKIDMQNEIQSTNREDFMHLIRKFIVNQFKPDMNHQKRFLDFLKF